METTAWRQRKSSSAKMESAAEMLQVSSGRINGKARVVPPGSGVKPERARRSLNEKLSTVVSNSRAEDGRMSRAYGKTEAEEMFLGHEDLGIEFIASSDASDELLKQLESLLMDHGRTMNGTDDDAMIGIKIERKQREDDQAEVKRRLESLASENRKLRSSLAVKEKLVETLHDRKSRLESEYETLMGRLDSMEKENAFLRYEYRVLEKDHEAGIEEMENARRCIDLAHREQLRSVNKIVELEAECQRLRLLIRKKLPEATILLQPKVRSDAGERKMETRKRNARIQNQKLHHDLLMEEIGNVWEENKNLKEIIQKKNMEIRDLSRGLNKKTVELAKNDGSLAVDELSQVETFDVGSEDAVSSLGSSSKALVSELRDERFKNPKVHRVTGASEMSLYMEDFAEMEKFAIVSTDKNPREDEEDHRPFDWLQAVLSAISKQQRISKRSAKELLQDIKIALGCMDASKDTKKPEGESALLCLTWKSPSFSAESGSMTMEQIKRHLGLGTRNLTADEESLDLQKASVETENAKQDLLQEESKDLKDEIENIESESKELRLKLKESEEKVRTLETEMETLKDCKDTLEAKIETVKSNNEDLDTQLGVTRSKLNEAQQLSSLEVELDFHKTCCEELEGTCLELQLQLESVEKKEPRKYHMEKNRKKSQNGWDVAAASSKLAECQDMILKLRKELKALALPSNLSASSSETRSITKFPSKGSSLRDQMLIQDNAKKLQNNQTVHDGDDDDHYDDDKNCNAMIVYTPRVYSVAKEEEERREGFTTMAMVQSDKKHGFGFLKKILFSRGRRGTSKKCLALTMR